MVRTSVVVVWLSALIPGFGFQAPSDDARAVIVPRHKVERAPTSIETPSAVVRVDSSLVLVPVHVTTVVGAPVANLTRENFQIFEDGVEQKITQFAKDDAPVSVALVFDASGSMKNKLQRSAEAAAALFQSPNPEDEFCLVEFNWKPRLVVPFTADLRGLSHEIIRIKATGRTSLLDAIYLALTETKAAHNTRKAIVVLSDGGDNWSRHSLHAVKNALLESDVQVYAMGIYDSDYLQKRAAEERNGPRLLGDLAEQTGGREYAVDNLDDLPAIGARIGAELRTQYLLGYSPANKTRDGKYRRVRVRVTPPPELPRLHIDYRQGYYSVAE